MVGVGNLILDLVVLGVSNLDNVFIVDMMNFEFLEVLFVLVDVNFVFDKVIFLFNFISIGI